MQSRVQVSKLPIRIHLRRQPILTAQVSLMDSTVVSVAPATTKLELTTKLKMKIVQKNAQADNGTPLTAVALWILAA